MRCDKQQVVDHDELALVRPAILLQEDPRALVAQQPQLRAAVGGRAVTCVFAPARPVLRQDEVVRETGGVGHGERVGREELRGGDRARARDVAATPAYQSQLKQRWFKPVVQGVQMPCLHGPRVCGACLGPSGENCRR